MTRLPHHGRIRQDATELHGVLRATSALQLEFVRQGDRIDRPLVRMATIRILRLLRARGEMPLEALARLTQQALHVSIGMRVPDWRAGYIAERVRQAYEGAPLV